MQLQWQWTTPAALKLAEADGTLEPNDEDISGFYTPVRDTATPDNVCSSNGNFKTPAALKLIFDDEGPLLNYWVSPLGGGAALTPEKIDVCSTDREDASAIVQGISDDSFSFPESI